MALFFPLVVGLVGVLFLLFLYIRLNDARLTHIPKSVLSMTPIRATPENIRQTDARLKSAAPISIVDQLPPKTGRRYLVVGGSGFVGGWMVLALLQRGEDPRRIRIIDIRPPTRYELTVGEAKKIQFVAADITDAASVEAAFNAAWVDGVSLSSEITVFHTAANIRPYERHLFLLAKSTVVNVNGTQNVLDAARSVGATTLVYTSSGSVAVRSSGFLLWPWEQEPRNFVQPINDDDNLIPKRHEDFFSNYAVAKIEAERRVRAADKTASRGGLLRTGCIRPSNSIFGYNDTTCTVYLSSKSPTPTWIKRTVQNFIYVENCTLAHLLYEQRLIELSEGGKNPDIGGQAFVVRDPGPPPTYGDLYASLVTLMDEKISIISVSPTLMLFIAYLLEAYHLTRHRILKWLPDLPSDLVIFQPSIFSLINVHLIFDDSRARLSPEKGGLGYQGAWTTLEGVHKTVQDFKLGMLRSPQVSDAADAGFGLAQAQVGVGKMSEKVAETVGIDPLQVLSSN
ncbi:hypothetical protein C8J57DRAFT_1224522 [Mycena rebaudengoi]|nr:hypothetical protein C8J57DRAFT_1224522 [Mycena rebaudengoi]